jgi:hypothetical protein
MSNDSFISQQRMMNKTGSKAYIDINELRKQEENMANHKNLNSSLCMIKQKTLVSNFESNSSSKNSSASPNKAKAKQNSSLKKAQSVSQFHN